MKFLTKLFALCISLSCACCIQRQQVDLIITNANIYTVDDNFSKAQSFAVSNGKFVAIGTNKEIEKGFKSSSQLDINGKTIVPGLIDSHCHFYSLGASLQELNLTGTKSFDEVLNKVKTFQNENNTQFIVGHGWNQNDWAIKKYPTKKELDLLYPNIPVVLSQKNGHTMLVNQAALDLAEINNSTEISGGEIVKNNEQITGVLIDNAMSLIYDIIPNPTKKESIQALMDAEKLCFKYGLTTVDDAGLSKQTIDLIDSLQLEGEIKMRIYAMVLSNKTELDHYLKNGIFKSERLNVRSFKVYADGALGSRGAALNSPYKDRVSHFGSMVTDLDTLKVIAKKIANSNFQMNTHAIGDSANSFILDLYTKVLKSQTDRRWRIEHSQVIDPDDFGYFTDIIPSVQPSHATSDMNWAKNRLGEERMEGAYAYKKLLKVKGQIALGSDFPVENANPMQTFYAAVARKDLNGNPEEGFEIQNALSREEALKGMTIWAAYANFEENEKGSIEVGKLADFIVLNDNVMETNINNVPTIKVLKTFLNGEVVSDNNIQ